MATNKKNNEELDFSHFFKERPSAKNYGSSQKQNKTRQTVIIVVCIVLILGCGYFSYKFTRPVPSPANYRAPAGYHMTNDSNEPPRLESN